MPTTLARGDAGARRHAPPANPESLHYRYEGIWVNSPALIYVFEWCGPGMIAGRNWVIAPDGDTLSARWAALQKERDPVRKELLFHPQMRGDKFSGCCAVISTCCRRTMTPSQTGNKLAPVAKLAAERQCATTH